MASFIAIYVHTRWRVNRIDSYGYPTDRIFSICYYAKIKQCLTFVNRIDSYGYPTDRIFSICYYAKIKQCLTLWYP